MSIKLLVADDEDTIRRGVAKYIKLHTDRFDKIYEAENGQEAIDIVLKYQPDIILLDVQMPLKTGIEVMQEIGKAGLHPIIIILSGYDEFKYAQQALKYGAVEYLLKPIRATDILECLNNLADEHIGKEENEPMQQESVPKNPFVKEAQEYIYEHYAENISLSSVAEKIGISNGYLSTIFAQTLNCGFVDYLNMIRIERACGYLEQNYLKTYEVAYKVGFRDEKYFSKVFKKLKGMSPKEYRSMKC
ncbi:MAG: response regulator [Eubacterium sp.]